ncbi:CBO0543 family protein [Neobacillus sp. LXY-4]|uniref:CBO0543 family protein n=1 Tax=Neobacillus sp. LXY-4 TaxID=3379826 RepID=UPI003EDF7311
MEFLPTIFLGMLLGTYLDLYFVGKKMYSFPWRPLSDIFSINILFTLVVLPILIGFFLSFVKKMRWWARVRVIFFISLLAAVCEKSAEELGIFIHSSNWKHYYSFIGYFVYLMFLLLFYLTTKRDRRG